MRRSGTIFKCYKAPPWSMKTPIGNVKKIVYLRANKNIKMNLLVSEIYFSTFSRLWKATVVINGQNFTVIDIASDNIPAYFVGLEDLVIQDGLPGITTSVIPDPDNAGESFILSTFTIVPG